MNQAFTAVARGDAGIGEVWVSLLVLAGFLAVAVWLGSRAFHRVLSTRA